MMIMQHVGAMRSETELDTVFWLKVINIDCFLLIRIELFGPDETAGLRGRGRSGGGHLHEHDRG